MENKLLRIFSISFFIACVVFTVCMITEIYKYLVYGIEWIPVQYFFLILPTPVIGYVMMRIGEYFDNRKNKKLQL